MRISDPSKPLSIAIAAATIGLLSTPDSAFAAVFDLSVAGTDAIFLAGRTDITIPPLGTSDPAFPLERDSTLGSNFEPETFPPSIGVAAGDTLQVTNAGGGIDFTDFFIPFFVGPEGIALNNLNLDNVGGISGYQGPQGALSGVFLDDSVPSLGPAPSTLNFTPSGLGRNFTNLTPELGQVFFIGDGRTNTDVLQEFIAPTGATRLFLGVPDSFLFSSVPGGYEDNDGSYEVTLNLIESPTTIPEPSAVLGLLATMALGGKWVKRKE